MRKCPFCGGISTNGNRCNKCGMNLPNDGEYATLQIGKFIGLIVIVVFIVGIYTVKSKNSTEPTGKQVAETSRKEPVVVRSEVQAETEISEIPEITEEPINYDSLTEEEYKSQCKEMFRKGIFFSKENLKGQIVKLKTFVEEAKSFNANAMLDTTTSDFIKEHDLQKNLFFCGIADEENQNAYVGEQYTLFFSNRHELNATDYHAGNHIIVYGEIVEFSTKTWNGYNKCSVIPRYIENLD